MSPKLDSRPVAAATISTLPPSALISRHQFLSPPLLARWGYSAAVSAKPLPNLPQRLLLSSTSLPVTHTRPPHRRPPFAVSPAEQDPSVDAINHPNQTWMKELIGAVEKDLSGAGDALLRDINGSDPLEALKMVDLIERLGIQRFFQRHIERILRLCYMQWHEQFGFKDNINATVLGFRLLRLHGYHVSTGILETLKAQNGRSDFSTFNIDTPEDILGMINLFKCSQVSFPSESKLMNEASQFATCQLHIALLQGHKSLLQTNNLEMEIKFTLEYPRRYLLQRLESRSIVRQLWHCSSGWTQRCLHLAKIDIDTLQKLHLQEISSLDQWLNEQEFSKHIPFRGGILKCYFAACAAVYEPQFSAFRIAFSKAACFATIVDDQMDSPLSDPTHLQKFNDAIQRWDPSICDDDVPIFKSICASLFATLNEIVAQASRIQGYDVLPYYKSVWQELVSAFMNEVNWRRSGHLPGLEEYLKTARPSISGTALFHTSVFLMNEVLSDEALRVIGQWSRFMQLSNYVSRLTNDLVTFEREVDAGEAISLVSCYMREHPGCKTQQAMAAIDGIIEASCRELEWELFKSWPVVPECCSRGLLNLARTTSFLYKRGDGFSLEDDKAYAKLVQDYIYHPLLVSID